MNRYPILRTILLILALLLPQPAMAAPAPVLVLAVEGAIGPATADYASRGIIRAARDGAQLVVLRIDTPGGLDSAMRQIIKHILASPVPVATYVAPSGARAASAGTYILYASHIAAMAPGTNLGAATPVQIGAPSAPSESKKDGKAGDEMAGQAMAHKQINDAAAYIRGLAQLRGRNAEWAEKAVREAVSLPAQEALKLHVTDIISSDFDELLKQLEGRNVSVLGQEKTLHTAQAPIITYEPDWRTRMLAVITDPSIALILIAVGVYGLFFEFLNPGAVLPGVLGGISMLLALYALQLLPVNYAGLALIALGLAFMISEVFLPSGVLGVGGIIAFVIGSLILIDTEVPGFGIPVELIVSVAAISALLLAAIASIALKTRRRPVVGAGTGFSTEVAEVTQPTPDGAWVLINGENWRAVSKKPLQPGQKVRVLERKGLVLEVAPLN